MSEERRQEGLCAQPIRRIDAPLAPRREEEALPVGELRLAREIRRLRRDDDALSSLLADLPSWQRLPARVILIRELGAGPARDLCDRAFGAGQAQFHLVQSEARPPVELHLVDLASASRAHALSEMLGRLLGGADRETLVGLLAAVEPQVATAAMSWLRAMGGGATFAALDAATGGAAANVARGLPARPALGRDQAELRVNDRGAGVAMANLVTGDDVDVQARSILAGDR